MAIDSREKRQSLTHIHLYANGPGITPNASQDKEWRQESGYGYPGILVGGGVTSVFPLISGGLVNQEMLVNGGLVT